MKLTELVKQKNVGTYVGIRFDADTMNDFEDYIKENKIPNGLKKDDLHTTVIYSKKNCPDFKPKGKISMTGHPENFEIWPSQPDEKTGHISNCLVLKYKCDEMCKRHEDIKKEHGATHGYDDFIPHTTLSYDVKDMDISKLPPFNKTLNIKEEYKEDLVDNWSNK